MNPKPMHSVFMEIQQKSRGQRWDLCRVTDHDPKLAQIEIIKIREHFH